MFVVFRGAHVGVAVALILVLIFLVSLVYDLAWFRFRCSVSQCHCLNLFYFAIKVQRCRSQTLNKQHSLAVINGEISIPHHFLSHQNDDIRRCCYYVRFR